MVSGSDPGSSIASDTDRNSITVAGELRVYRDGILRVDRRYLETVLVKNGLTPLEPEEETLLTALSGDASYTSYGRCILTVTQLPNIDEEESTDGR